MSENTDFDSGDGERSNCTSCDNTSTVTIQENEQLKRVGRAPEGRRVVLRLKKPEPKKKVLFTAGTIDNENMGKKKSKCCCIYKKPLMFGESSSESEDECDNCPGHGHSKRKDDEDPPSPPSVPPV